MQNHLVPHRVESIDGLRALSVAIVLLGHAFPFLYPGGGVGVSVFFVISGFVITNYLLINKPKMRQFYQSRIQRLMPPALLVVAATWLLFEAGLVKTSYWSMAASVFSFMNWRRAFPEFADDGGVLGHYWSLSIEEQFYLIWPIILLLLLKDRKSAFRFLVIAIATLSIWRFYLFFDGASAERIYNGLDTRADALLVGCLLAYVRFRDLGWLTAAALAGIVICGALPLDEASLASQIAHVVVIFLSAVAVSGCISGSGAWRTALESRPFQWLGHRSYAVYLWHYPLMGAASYLGVQYGVRGLIYMGAAIAASLLAAEATYRLIEKPLRDARHHRDDKRVTLRAKIRSRLGVKTRQA